MAVAEQLWGGKIKIDIGEDVEEQEDWILNFHKAPNIDRYRPF